MTTFLWLSALRAKKKKNCQMTSLAAASGAPMTTKELANFLRVATTTLASPEFIRRLGGVVLGAPSPERGALVEQLLAREYLLAWQSMKSESSYRDRVFFDGGIAHTVDNNYPQIMASCAYFLGHHDF